MVGWVPGSCVGVRGRGRGRGRAAGELVLRITRPFLHPQVQMASLQAQVVELSETNGKFRAMPSLANALATSPALPSADVIVAKQRTDAAWKALSTFVTAVIHSEVVQLNDAAPLLHG